MAAQAARFDQVQGVSDAEPDAAWAGQSVYDGRLQSAISITFPGELALDSQCLLVFGANRLVIRLEPGQENEFAAVVRHAVGALVDLGSPESIYPGSRGG